jgi:hypothetical protein
LFGSTIQVRRQMKLRLKNHEDRNAARKKTDEEKREKKIAKLGETHKVQKNILHHLADFRLNMARFFYERRTLL